ncbi:MAG: hypothetical protein KDB23_07700 [Planctomycetales bacterium]|nr:hypothetical protein [Planctomycetales bacterium]
MTKLSFPLAVVLFATMIAGSQPAARAWGQARDAANLGETPTSERSDWLVGAVQRTSGVYRGIDSQELVIDNGLVRRTFRVSPNLACVDLQQLTANKSLVRAVRPECIVTIDGHEYAVGGLTGQPIGNFLKPEWYPGLSNDPDSFQFDSFEISAIEPRFPWRRRPAWTKENMAWPPAGIHVKFHFLPPLSIDQASPLRQSRVTVHYELYDGLPLMCKWFTLRNDGESALHLDSFKSEQLACVEAGSAVEDIDTSIHPNVHVETDFTSCAMDGVGSQRDVVHWLADLSYQTQVNYRLETPCLLECSPPLGPDVDVNPGQEFESFRTWELWHDRRDELRQSLGLSRMYRTIAPWVTENPLIHHVRSADPASVRLAVDQCADVGFELVVMTFGSGFNLENDSTEYLRQVREMTEYSHIKGIALGGYSLLASRSVNAENDVVNPATGQPGGFARFGNSPCLQSEWGRDYFRKLYEFYELTGCDVLEHDGSYPGDVCASESHPGHQHLDDSRWKQWETIRDYYRWCRARGIYLNVPDWYFLNGSNKTGMGYRETNWSLPRNLQEIIERQNIHDGTRFKTPTMGWMFVPLTEYHGGGPAATIEPLSEHLDHYQRRLQNLLGGGVQACFRGPRLYDAETTRQMLKRWVAFYKQHREILDSDLVPLRRADGRDWDGWLHVKPGAHIPAMAIIYNPLPDAIERTIDVPLYYAGLSESARVTVGDGESQTVKLDRQETARIQLKIPAHGCQCIVFE